MFENLILVGAFAVFAIVLLGVGLVVLVAIVRALRRPRITPDPAPMSLLSRDPIDPISAFNTASDGHMQHALFSDIGKARAEKWKREMGDLLAPKPPSPTPPATPPPNV